MTKWSEFPLRPQGQPWPGLNTKGGRLDPGQGQLEDGSFNAIINESDILQKWKGLIRGLDERFSGVVCGLFRYTDDCGREFIIVADQDGIKVRVPFDIPEFLGSDSIPFDDFQSLDPNRWSPITVYEVFIGSLRLNGLDSQGISTYVPAPQLMQWFKESVLTSYYVEINYRMEASDDRQVVSVVTKRNSLGTTYLEAAVFVDGSTYQLNLFHVIGGTRSTLATSELGGATLADGFLRLSYDAGSFTATAMVIPSGGSQVSISGTLTEFQDAGLGQFSAIGIRRETADVAPEIESVSGGQL